MKGPRIYVKNDDESSIGRGCRLYGSHFVPEIARIVWAASRAAPPDCISLKLSEGERNIRSKRDLHEECRALDLTGEVTTGERLTRSEYEDMADLMCELLGPDYDVVVHGDHDMNSKANLHIHAEYDPR